MFFSKNMLRIYIKQPQLYVIFKRFKMKILKIFCHTNIMPSTQYQMIYIQYMYYLLYYTSTLFFLVN